MGAACGGGEVKQPGSENASKPKATGGPPGLSASSEARGEGARPTHQATGGPPGLSASSEARGEGARLQAEEAKEATGGRRSWIFGCASRQPSCRNILEGRTELNPKEAECRSNQEPRSLRVNPAVENGSAEEEPGIVVPSQQQQEKESEELCGKEALHKELEEEQVDLRQKEMVDYNVHEDQPPTPSHTTAPKGTPSTDQRAAPVATLGEDTATVQPPMCNDEDVISRMGEELGGERCDDDDADHVIAMQVMDWISGFESPPAPLPSSYMHHELADMEKYQFQMGQEIRTAASATDEDPPLVCAMFWEQFMMHPSAEDPDLRVYQLAVLFMAGSSKAALAEINIFIHHGMASGFTLDNVESFEHEELDVFAELGSQRLKAFFGKKKETDEDLERLDQEGFFDDLG